MNEILIFIILFLLIAGIPITIMWLGTKAAEKEVKAINLQEVTDVFKSIEKAREHLSFEKDVQSSPHEIIKIKLALIGLASLESKCNSNVSSSFPRGRCEPCDFDSVLACANGEKCSAEILPLPNTLREALKERLLK